MLDQILISQALTVAPPGAKFPAFDYDIVHTNSEFHDQDSDHDPGGSAGPPGWGGLRPGAVGRSGLYAVWLGMPGGPDGNVHPSHAVE